MEFLKKNILFLAPMAGYTDSACRRIFRESGADAVVSEFVYCRAIISDAARVFEKLSFSEADRPFGVQIFGSDTAEMALSAKIVEDRISPDFIDVNFGCPAPNAVGAGAGSALLKNVPQMVRIIEAMSSAVARTPITAKMRTGWSLREIVVPQAAVDIQNAGAQMITLHGRTKSQGYSGDADWELIERTAESLSVPLIGNGSVEKLSAGRLRSSACTGFMIGRAALGNPWIFSEINAYLENPDCIIKAPTLEEKLNVMCRHIEKMVEYKGEHMAMLQARKLIAGYFKGMRGAAELRNQSGKVCTLNDLYALKNKALSSVYDA